MAIDPGTPAPRRSNRTRNIGIGCGVLLLLCIGLGILSAALGGNQGTSTTASVAPTTAPSGGQAAAPAATSAPAQAKATEAKVAPTATAAPKIGQPITSGNWEYTITRTGRDKTLDAGFGKAEAKGEFFVVYMTIKNIGKENFGINGHDFELVTGDGVKYNTTSDFNVSGWLTKNKLTGLGQQQPPGIPSDVALVFDINPAATGLRLNLKQARNTMVDLGE